MKNFQDLMKFKYLGYYLLSFIKFCFTLEIIILPTFQVTFDISFHFVIFLNTFHDILRVKIKKKKLTTTK